MAESNCLIIPLKVKAMYEPGDNQTKYGDILWKMDTLLVDPIGSAVEPGAFAECPPFSKGIYLHWILPDAFTKGSIADDGTSQFPLICNYYQVYRFIEDLDGEIIKGAGEKNWVVKSPNDLTAIQNANAAYAANYQQCKSSLGLYDDLEGLSYEKGKLCYGIIGLFEHSEDDPITKLKDISTFLQYLTDHEFSVEDKQLCQNMLWIGGTSIPMDVNGLECMCPVPDMDIQVAIGNNSMEALAALLSSELTNAENRQKKSQIEKLILQLLYRKTDDSDSNTSDYLLEDEIHNRCFLADTIGQCYETDDEQEKDLVTQLNEHAHNYNRLRAELKSLQQEVYFIWYLSVSDSYGRPMSQEKIEQYFQLKDKYVIILTEYVSRIQDEQQQIKSLITKFHHLKTIDEELFWKPSTPCVLFMGEGLQRKYLHGYDTYFQEDNLLPCCIWKKDIEILRNNDIKDNILSAQEWNTCIDDWEDPWSPLFFEWNMAYYPDEDTDWTLNGMDYIRKNNDVQKEDIFSGIGVLSPYITEYISDVLGEYKEKFSSESDEYKMIEELSQKMERMDILSQTMGSFHTQLYAKNEGYQSTCTKTGVLGDEYDQAMVSLYDNQNNYSPMYNSNFYWKRNGIGEILRLRILDGYGRYRTLEQNRFSCIFPESFRKGIEDMPENRFLLPPRIMQPHRIRVSLGNNNNPVLAWLMPNLFDGTIAVYNNEGQMIGYLYSQIIIKNEVRKKESRFKRINNQVIGDEIQSWIDGILVHNNDLNMEENALEQLLFYLENVFIQNPKDNVSSSEPVFLAESRVIALVNVLIHMDCMGWKAHSPKDIMNSNSSYGDMNGEEFDIFCGNSNYPKDGLFGFYQAMNQLHICWKYDEKSYLKLDNSIKIKDQGESVSLLYMMDPQKSVVITSGILPNYFFEIDPELVNKIINQINVRLKVDTLFNAGKEILIPLPDSKNHNWSWEDLTAQEYPVSNLLEKKDHFNESKQIIEGWLVYKK